MTIDTIIESALEEVAGDTKQPPPKDGRGPDAHLPYSDYEWNRALAYGVRFDEVNLQQTKSAFQNLVRPMRCERGLGGILR